MLGGARTTPGGSAAIAFIHQDLGLIEWMTVAENIALAQGYPRRGLIDWHGSTRGAASLALIAPTSIPGSASAT